MTPAWSLHWKWGIAKRVPCKEVANPSNFFSTFQKQRQFLPCSKENVVWKEKYHLKNLAVHAMGLMSCSPQCMKWPNECVTCDAVVSLQGWWAPQWISFILRAPWNQSAWPQSSALSGELHTYKLSTKQRPWYYRGMAKAGCFLNN